MSGEADVFCFLKKTSRLNYKRIGICCIFNSLMDINPGAAAGFKFFTILGRPASVKVDTVLGVAFVKARRM